MYFVNDRPAPSSHLQSGSRLFDDKQNNFGQCNVSCFHFIVAIAIPRVELQQPVFLAILAMPTVVDYKPFEQEIIPLHLSD